MNEIPFNDVLLSPAVLTRWQEEVADALRIMQDAGINPRPGEDTMIDLGDGRLRLICQAAPGFSVVLDAEPGEWSRLSSN